ncbi:MAG: glycine dehydrogenase, partial [Niveispirillum sp.]|nr:glycine dehydrogenase [Niveispirillum sp.]
HIRREKATSNICTNSGLCALAFTIHLSLLGEQGLVQLARINHANAVTLADKLSAVKGVSVVNDGFFNEFTVKLPKKAAKVVSKLAAKDILAGVPVSRLYPDVEGLDDLLLIAATEINSVEDMDALVRGLEEVL